jgi:hypothetical protein
MPHTRNDQLPSSPGKNSRSMTPKDVSKKDAASKDLTERHLASGERDEREESLLDDAVDMTFPASDPTAVSGITRKTAEGKEEGERKAEQGKEQEAKKPQH